jgi:hypothetical protein
MRREAQEIVPGLLLGAYNTATNADRLVEAGITHLYVLCVENDGTTRLSTKLPDYAYGMRGRYLWSALGFPINSYTTPSKSRIVMCVPSSTPPRKTSTIT